jgi:DnaJ-class molecular chaperone
MGMFPEIKKRNNCPGRGKPVVYIPSFRADFGLRYCDECGKKWEKARRIAEKELMSSRKYIDCSFCHGTGKVNKYNCVECNGMGGIKEQIYGYEIDERANEIFRKW